MMKFLNNVRTRKTGSISRRRSDRFRREMLQLETLEHRVVFDGDGPQALNDIYTAETGVALQVAVAGVLTNDTPGESSPGSPMTALSFRGPTHGTLELSEDGSFVYTPNEGFQGVDGFLYRAKSGESTSNIAAVTIRVESSNQGPIANDESYSVAEDGALDVGGSQGVLVNDTDANSDPLALSVVTSPSHGTLTLEPNGGFQYIPNANFNGSDTFVYSASDGTSSDEATVTIEVTAVNDDPVAGNDKYSVDEDAELTVAAAGVLSNDSDLDGDSLSAVLDVGPEHGELTLGVDGKFTYKPASNFHGTDAFSYRASDGTGSSGIVVVEILVNSINDAPVAQNDNYSIDEEGFLEVAAISGLLSNDTDADGDLLKAQIDSSPEHGVLLLADDGSFTYRPNPNFSGTDAFSYRAFDGVASSEIVVVEIVVNAANDVPVAANDNYQVLEDGVLTVAANGVLANDTDADLDPLEATLFAEPEHGQLTLNEDGSFTYTPDANFHGTDAFSYRATDGTDFSEVIAVQIDIESVNDAPIGQDDSYVTEKGAKLVVVAPGVLTNDSDADGDPIQAELGVAPAHGQLLLNPDGSFEYTPDPNFRGVDSFTYTATDGSVDSPLNTVRIKVGGENTRPIAVNDSFIATADTVLNVSLSQGVTQNDIDAEGDLLSAQLYRTTRFGLLSLNGDGSFSYTPNQGFVGTDSFLYRVNDGELNSLLAAVTIHVRASVPTPLIAGANATSLRMNRIDQAVAGLSDDWSESTIPSSDLDLLIGPQRPTLA